MTLHSLSHEAAGDIASLKRGAREQGFIDVEFHFLVRRDGHIERGRPMSMTSMVDDDLDHARAARAVSVMLVDARGQMTDEQTRVVEALNEDFEVLDRRS